MFTAMYTAKFFPLPHLLTACACISVFGLQKTPLYVAAEEGYAKIISLLTDAGAQLEAEDNNKVILVSPLCGKGAI